MLGWRARSLFIPLLPLLSALPALLACGGPAGVAPIDASVDSAAESASGDAGGALVTQCVSLAQNFQSKCAGSDPRPCLWAAYGKLCATGQTQLLVDSMNCLDSTTCRTFSDPNQAATCLAQVHASGESAAAKAFVQGLCGSCGCAADSGTLEVIPYLTDADLAALSGCNAALCALFGGADGGVDAGSCFAGADIAPFVACP